MRSWKACDGLGRWIVVALAITGVLNVVAWWFGGYWFSGLAAIACAVMIPLNLRYGVRRRAFKETLELYAIWNKEEP